MIQLILWGLDALVKRDLRMSSRRGKRVSSLYSCLINALALHILRVILRKEISLTRCSWGMSYLSVGKPAFINRAILFKVFIYISLGFMNNLLKLDIAFYWLGSAGNLGFLDFKCYNVSILLSFLTSSFLPFISRPSYFC